MALFLTLFTKLIPLYLTIIFGFFLGRIFNIKGKWIGLLLIYCIAPLVVFNGVLKTELDFAALLLPFIFFLLCCLISLCAFYLGGKFLDGKTRSIFAFAAGSGNTGYFGLPVAIYLFSENIIGLAILAAFGFILYENTIGFYIAAREQHALKKSLIKVLGIPTIYALCLGIFFNFSGYKIPPLGEEILLIFQKIYSYLGMILIGLGISQYLTIKPNFLLIGISFVTKFLIWPAITLLFIKIDTHFLHLFQPLTHQLMLLMSIVPLPVNSIAIAIVLKFESNQIAGAVFASTLFALFYIPLLYNWI